MKKRYYFNFLSVLVLCLFFPIAKNVYAADENRSVETEAGVMLRKVDKVPDSSDESEESKKPEKGSSENNKPYFPQTGETENHAVIYAGITISSLALIGFAWNQKRKVM